jgi:hypothetical protein
MSRHQPKRQLRLSTWRELDSRWRGPANFAGGAPVCCCPRTRLATAFCFLADTRRLRAQTVRTHLRALRTLSFLNGCLLHRLPPGLGRGGCRAAAWGWFVSRRARYPFASTEAPGSKAACSQRAQPSVAAPRPAQPLEVKWVSRPCGREEETAFGAATRHWHRRQ